MDLHYRQARKKFFFWLSCNVINTLLLSANPANAETIIAPVDNLPLQDLTNFSFQNLVGPRFEVDLPDGTRCTSQDGTPIAFNLYGGLSERSDESRQYTSSRSMINGVGQGVAVGAAITVPLFSRNTRNCDEAYSLTIANKKIELATLLHQEGLLSDDDLAKLLNQVKQVLLSE